MKETTFKGWLVSNNIKQREIMELLDISYQATNEKINGKRNFTLDQVRTLCDHYGISADIFLNNPLKKINTTNEG